MWFGNLNTGSGGSAELWKFISGSSGDIDLKTASGVTGINAVNPQDGKLFLSNTKFGTDPVTGAAYINGDVIGGAGITQFGGVGLYRALLFFANLVSGDVANRTATDNFQIQDNCNDGVKYSNVSQDKVSITKEVGDLTTLNRVQTNQSENSYVVRIQIANLDVLNFGADANGFIITDGTNQRFRITPLGNIQTDQAQAPGVHAVLTKELPIYDMAGALIGYIPIFT